MAATGSPDADFDAFLALEPRHETLLRALRQLVLTLHPGAVEVVRLGDRALSWGWGEKKMSEAYAYAIPYAGHVNLGFYRGTSLPDPAGRLAGTGKAMRHLRLSAPTDLDDPTIAPLLVAARDERHRALFEDQTAPPFG